MSQERGRFELKFLRLESIQMQRKWTKPDKAMACLRAALSPAARTVYKYSLGLAEDDQKKPHMVLDALREYYGAIAYNYYYMIRCE